MARQRKWGAFSITEALDEAFENGKGEIDMLFEEMDEWRNNMEQSEGLTQTMKFEEVEEAANILESAQGNLEDVELANLNLATDTVTFIENKQRRPARHVRCSNAAARLEAVKDYLQHKTENEKDEVAVEKLEEQVEYLEEATGELEGIMFPGMY